MRKHQQKQILEFVQTLFEGNDEVRRLLSAGKAGTAVNLLADCQDSAVQIGSYIEQLEGEGTKTVALLEEYCELLYKTSMDISGGDPAGHGIKALRKCLIKIENSVKADLKPNKIEMLFLPYKASMWDSMESVWLAADADPACDAVVMPIPYYDRNPDGSLGLMHYEGKDLPKSVPVTKYDSYDIEARHPDVIIIHNPYDDGNYVTSVHPDFYSKRLKNLTELLVYIPYFVVAEGGEVEEQFCTSAGCVFADLVVVQSEKVRSSYIQAYGKQYGNRFGKPEDKFVAWGSPKYDRALSTRRDACELPEEWRRKIKNRRIILYNTSIGSILSGGVQYLRKLRDTLAMFEERRDLILWWRPHPLSRNTYASMRPQLLKEYSKIVADYWNEGYGVYDDTPDLSRALVWSDAYYGDPSSLIGLYEAMGKPMMVQSLDIISSQHSCPAAPYSLSLANIAKVDDYYYSTHVLGNAMFRYDNETWAAEFVGCVPAESSLFWRFYTSAAVYEKSIFYAPYSANEIAEYDTVQDFFTKIPLPAVDFLPEIIEYDDTRKFLECLQYKQWIIFIPCTFPGILRYNTETRQLDIFHEWVRSSHDFVGKGIDKLDVVGYFGNGSHIIGEVIYAPSKFADMILEFNMENGESKWIPIAAGEEKGDQGFSTAAFDGKRFFLMAIDGSAIVIWSPGNGVVEVVAKFPPGYEPVLNGYSLSAFDGEDVHFLPAFGNKALRMDPNSFKVSVDEVFQPELDTKHEIRYFPDHYQFAARAGESIFAQAAGSNHLVEYNAGKRMRKEQPVTTADIGSMRRLLVIPRLQQGVFIQEQAAISGSMYLEALAEYWATSPNAPTHGARSADGKNIYEHIKNWLGGSS